MNDLADKDSKQEKVVITHNSQCILQNDVKC